MLIGNWRRESEATEEPLNGYVASGGPQPHAPVAASQKPSPLMAR